MERSRLSISVRTSSSSFSGDFFMQNTRIDMNYDSCGDSSSEDEFSLENNLSEVVTHDNNVYKFVDKLLSELTDPSDEEDFSELEFSTLRSIRNSFLELFESNGNKRSSKKANKCNCSHNQLCKSCDHYANPQRKPCYMVHKQDKNGKPKRKTVTKETRKQILKTFNNQCAYQKHANCKRKLTLDNMQVDHIVSFARGGYDGPPNLYPCCKSCNSSKRDNDLAVWCQDKCYCQSH